MTSAAEVSAKVAWTPKPATDRRMFAAFEWLLAWRYLRARRQEGFISVIAGFSLGGVALGVGTLIVVMAVMNGFRTELFNKILALNGHVRVMSAGTGLSSYDQVAQRIKSIPGVVRAVPLIEGQAFATANKAGVGVIVRGVSPGDLSTFAEVTRKLTPGALQRFQGGNQILMGTRLADQLGLLPGMTITLLSARGNVTPFGVTPRAKAYTIAGTFATDMAQVDNGMLIMPIQEAQAYFNLAGMASAIDVFAADATKSEALKEKIAELLPPPARILDWREVHSTFFDVLKVEANVMFLILSLMILIAAFNIVSGMIMLVKDKGRDIAILRTMGASRGAILRIFLIAGSAIGFAGTALGLVLGVLFALNVEPIRQFVSWLFNVRLFDPVVYQLTQMPSRLELWDVIWVAGMALTLSVLATLYPAWRAARLDPIEALRYE
jgi:lipoprotein-releasing system permease protein